MVIAGGFLTPQEQAGFPKNVRIALAINQAANTYAECVVSRSPVPAEAKDILTRVTGPEERIDRTEYIANRINALIGEDIFFIKPLPPFLRPHFRQVTPDDLVRAAPSVIELVTSGAIPNAALLHMDTCETFWMHSSKSNDEIDQAIINYAQTYTTLAQALAIPAGALVPKHIIATEAEVRDTTQTAARNALLQANPDAVLVLDMGTATIVGEFDRHLLKGVRHLAIVGRNLTIIEESAFEVCHDVISVTIPNSVAAIGNNAFQGCGRLISVTIPNSLMTIGKAAFFGCRQLSRVTIPPSVTTIRGDAFGICKGLISVTIPNSVTNIGGYAFAGCTNLREIWVVENSYADTHMRDVYPQLAQYIRYMG